MFRILTNTDTVASPLPAGGAFAPRVVERPPHGGDKFEQLADWVFLRQRDEGYLLVRSYPFNVLTLTSEEAEQVRRFFAGARELPTQLLDDLRLAHMLDGEPQPDHERLNRHVSAILLVTTACNLTCSHCFASGGDYGLGRAHMGHDVIDATVSYLSRQILSLYVDQAYAGNAEFGMHFFGGEPFIAFDQIGRASCRERV